MIRKAAGTPFLAVYRRNKSEENYLMRKSEKKMKLEMIYRKIELLVASDPLRNIRFDLAARRWV